MMPGYICYDLPENIQDSPSKLNSALCQLQLMLACKQKMENIRVMQDHSLKFNHKPRERGALDKEPYRTKIPIRFVITGILMTSLVRKIRAIYPGYMGSKFLQNLSEKCFKVLYDHSTHENEGFKFYKMALRPAVLHKSESWATEKSV